MAEPTPSPASSRLRFPIALSLAAGVAFLLVFLWVVPRLQTVGLQISPVERVVLESQLRDTWAKILWAFLTLGGALLVARYLVELARVVEQSAQTLAAAERNAFFSAQAQTTERYARAMALLGDEKIEVRLGGIYALERIARESKEDHGPIMEVLAAFVREHAAWREGEPTPPRLRADLQAILSVLGRRRAEFDPSEGHLDLHGTSLAHAYLPWAKLPAAFLYETNLAGAILQNADLRGAWLWKTNLDGVSLDGAHLEGADLTGVSNLSAEQLRGAFTDENTKLPQQLRELAGAKPVVSEEITDEDLKIPTLR